MALVPKPDLIAYGHKGQKKFGMLLINLDPGVECGKSVSALE